MTVHGLRKHKLYDVWSSMKYRCNKPTSRPYKYYGARGIRVCRGWNKFLPFFNWATTNGWKEGLQLDREDNDGDYSPENCRFVTPQVNMGNRRPYSGCGETSKYNGVNLEKGRFRAQIHHESKCKRLGSFKTEEEAVTARDKFIIENGLSFPLQFLFGP